MTAVCMMSVCEIYQRMIIKLTVQTFAILCLFFYFVFVQFVCHATQMPCQLVSLNIKTISMELLDYRLNMCWVFLSFLFFFFFFFFSFSFCVGIFMKNHVCKSFVVRL